MVSTTTTGLLLFSILICVCFISVTTRPCQTIFFISSSSSSSSDDDHFLTESSLHHLFRNPNNSPRVTFFVTTEIQHTRSLRRHIFFDPTMQASSSGPAYYSASSSVKTSIRERTMDIMSIVGALIFGVGYGALAAATMYLIRSLFAPRGYEYGDDDSDEDTDDEENDVKHDDYKNGYLAIPVVTKPVPPTADEVAAMKG